MYAAPGPAIIAVRHMATIKAPVKGEGSRKILTPQDFRAKSCDFKPCIYEKNLAT
jgi:hypothetical protein